MGVSKTAVSTIIYEAKTEDPNYALTRALILKVAKDGSNVFQYAPCIRILNLLQDYQISPSDAEDLSHYLLPALYKGNWTVADAVDGLLKFNYSSETFGQTPSEHSSYFRKLRRQSREYAIQT